MIAAEGEVIQNTDFNVISACLKQQMIFDGPNLFNPPGCPLELYLSQGKFALLPSPASGRGAGGEGAHWNLRFFQEFPLSLTLTLTQAGEKIKQRGFLANINQEVTWRTNLPWGTTCSSLPAWLRSALGIAASTKLMREHAGFTVNKPLSENNRVRTSKH